MIPKHYKYERQKRGSQRAVAERLKIHRQTIAKRETGENPISLEAEIALLSLPVDDDLLK